MYKYIYLMNNFILIMIVIIFSMMSVAFLTLFERKILSYSHYRKGPNKVSYMGLLQPFSDAMKLMSKEFFYPLKSNLMFYLLTPLLMFFLIMSMWIMYPFQTNLLSWNLTTLYMLSLMCTGSICLMMMGWASNSSFSMLGSIRSLAQAISYEVTFSISFLLPLLMINSLNLYNLSMFNKFMMMFMMFWPSMMILFLSMLAEINRTPFDLSEGESELVSGFNVEYGNFGFVLIFLSEYASIMFMMFMFSWMNFCSNYMNLFFYMMSIILTYLIIWIRITLPRIRYDMLMYFCWFYMLPYMLLIFFMILMFMKYPMFFILN